MSRTIEIELSHDSVFAAIKQLYQYRQGMRKKYNEICRQLAELGAEEARRRFARGDYGNGDVTVTVEPIRNGYKIVASGHDVYFIEFGTGFFAGTQYGDGMPSTSVPVYPGSWSEEHEKQFSEKGYWYYEGEKLQGTEAEMPMYYAGKVIRENEKRIAKEILGK